MGGEGQIEGVGVGGQIKGRWDELNKSETQSLRKTRETLTFARPLCRCQSCPHFELATGDVPSGCHELHEENSTIDNGRAAAGEATSCNLGAYAGASETGGCTDDRRRAIRLDPSFFMGADPNARSGMPCAGAGAGASHGRHAFSGWKGQGCGAGGAEAVTDVKDASAHHKAAMSCPLNWRLAGNYASQRGAGAGGGDARWDWGAAAGGGEGLAHNGPLTSKDVHECRMRLGLLAVDANPRTNLGVRVESQGTAAEPGAATAGAAAAASAHASSSSVSLSVSACSSLSSWHLSTASRFSEMSAGNKLSETQYEIVEEMPTS